MIRLYRHDGLEFLLNINLINKVESTPATVITLLSGEKIKVKNTIADVVSKIKACRQGMAGENPDLDETPASSKRGKLFL